MKRSLAIVALMASVLGLAAPSGAQAPDSRSLRWVVPYAAGGGQDFFARTVGQQLSADLNRPVIIDNKPGANGSVAASDLLRAPADGLTIMSVDNGIVIYNPDLYKNLSYNLDRDMALVSTTGRIPLVLVAGPGTASRSAKEFFAEAKAAPGGLNYASAGQGSPHHIAMELVKKVTGAPLAHVPYRGGNPAISDVASGQVPVMMADLAFAGGFVKAGKVRVLAVADSVRMPQLPDVPTFAEIGMPGVVAIAFTGVVAAAGTPAATIESLSRALAKAIHNPAVAAKLSAASVEPSSATPAEFAAMVERERARWKTIQASQNIKVD